MPPKAIRHYNSSRIFHSIRAEPGITQREIVEAADTDKTTVSTVIRGFEQVNLVKRIEKPSSGGRGRPSEGYVISEDGGLLVGVHPRPDEVRFVLSDLTGIPMATLARPSVQKPEALGKAMADGISGLVISNGRKLTDIRAVGISIPGVVRPDGMVMQSPNLHWSGFNPKTMLEGELDLPVFCGNNADGITLAEALLTGIPGQRSFVLILSGSGVGGGVVVEGELLRSPTGLAGEFGHMKIEPHGRDCECGGKGCLNTYTSNYALLQILRENGIALSSFDEVVERVRHKDAAIAPFIKAYIERLGLGIANVIQVTGIPEIVLGGGFGRLLPYIEAELAATVRDFGLPSIADVLTFSVSLASSVERPVSGLAIALEGCTGASALDHAPWALASS